MGACTEIRARSTAASKACRSHASIAPRPSRIRRLKGSRSSSATPWKKSRGHVQGQVDQAGRCDGRDPVPAGPGAATPGRSPADRGNCPARGRKPARSGERPGWPGSPRPRVRTAYGDVAQSLGVFKPLVGHIAEPKRGLWGPSTRPARRSAKPWSACHRYACQSASSRPRASRSARTAFNGRG